MPDSSIIGAILTQAGVGCAIIVVLILTNALDPTRNTKRAQEEADKWHEAWNESQKTVLELQRANAAQTARGDAAVESAKHLTEVLERIQERRDEAVQPLPPRRRQTHGS